ncbi:MAG TPA: hypothetical protein DCX01_01840 [Bacteroidetes bacterium]|nr:hypothetical protein [Bacteroidota bacterium]
MLSDADYLESSSIVRTGFIAQEVEAAAQKVGFSISWQVYTSTSSTRSLKTTRLYFALLTTWYSITVTL